MAARAPRESNVLCFTLQYCEVVKQWKTNEDRKGTKWAGEYEESRAERTRLEKRERERDKPNEHVESQSAYRMSNETVRDRSSLIPPDIR